MKVFKNFRIPNARIVEAKPLEDGSCELVIIYDNAKTLFTLIEASKLSNSDEFMQYEPKTDKEWMIKSSLNSIISRGIKDFYRPIIDPSFDKTGKHIVFSSGLYPGIVQSFYWWCEKAKELNPERKSRIGTKSEYIAFLGVLIKKLVDNSWKIDDAWNAVCNDSILLGHYLNSNGEYYGMQRTGSNEVMGFFDLANTDKLVLDDETNEFFWIVGGNYSSTSDQRPLAFMHKYDVYNSNHFQSVGWLVLEE